MKNNFYNVSNKVQCKDSKRQIIFIFFEKTNNNKRCFRTYVTFETFIPI